ncbi:hypothetical protein [Bradyrhizobium sp. SZCCHNRI3037]|uniref:hypothetical protein n=2 Tax=Bradyrhizobium TaxID=374 RepID=UPI0029168309|nr:hypothetical protein [Bradyrhizobium sp. SZCCHNRI3037]
MTKREMINVHFFFLKLTGCMIAEAIANGHDVPIPLDPFSTAIMSGRPHPEIYLQFGKHDDGIGRSNLHVWTVDPGKSVFGGWLYKLDNVAVSVLYAQTGRFEHRRDIWHPYSRTSRKRFLIADFMYSKQARSKMSSLGKGEQQK